MDLQFRNNSNLKILSGFCFKKKIQTPVCFNYFNVRHLKSCIKASECAKDGRFQEAAATSLLYDANRKATSVNRGHCRKNKQFGSTRQKQQEANLKQIKCSKPGQGDLLIPIRKALR